MVRYVVRNPELRACELDGVHTYSACLGAHGFAATYRVEKRLLSWEVHGPEGSLGGDSRAGVRGVDLADTLQGLMHWLVKMNDGRTVFVEWAETEGR